MENNNNNNNQKPPNLKYDWITHLNYVIVKIIKYNKVGNIIK